MRTLLLALVLVVALATLAFFDCTLTSIGVLPLNDLGPGTYVSGTIGGLYPAGQDVRPAAHLAAGRAIATTEVLPRNAAGAVDLGNGKIGLISIGMSNTTQEFNGSPQAFKPKADADPAKDSHVVIVDGAQGGMAAADWADPTQPLWAVVASRVATAGLSPLQVQVAWVKLAEKQPGPTYGPYPAHTSALQADIETTLHNLVAVYPNVRLAFLSSRTRAYTDTFTDLNPEPFAYESGFAVRDLIAQQIAGAPSLAYALPSPQAPWLAWGPYLWADGTTARSDGLTWSCADTQPDFTHPSASGVQKVADQLVAYFKTDSTSTPWFLRHSVIGSPPTAKLLVGPSTGAAPLTTSIVTTISDPGGATTDAAWDFGDGCYKRAISGTKTYPAPGLYESRFTVTDNDGNTRTVVRTLSVLPTGSTQWTDLVLGLAGFTGTPGLAGSGTLVGSTPVGLHLSGARPTAPVVVVIGFSAINAPFKGGTLVPAPDILLFGFTSNALGLLNLGGTWPGGIPSGTQIWFQEWITDPAGPLGFAASNGLRATTP
ncbi:MAG TPA: PKD domain-containing protein [Planctomycetota bacterium]|nr:PKD domain-containing protein [Planctomycetota bacterium]